MKVLVHIITDKVEIKKIQNRLYMRSWVAKNRKRKNEIDRKSWENSSEERRAKKRAKDKAYKAANLEKFADYERKRRAIKNGLVHEPYTTEKVLEMFGSDCHICGTPIDLSAPRRSNKLGWENGLHIDHVIPVCNGGADSLENVRPSHGKCNTKKNRNEIPMQGVLI